MYMLNRTVIKGLPIVALVATRECCDITKLKYVLIQNRIQIIRISSVFKKTKTFKTFLCNVLPGLGENYAATQDPVTKRVAVKPQTPAEVST